MYLIDLLFFDSIRTSTVDHTPLADNTSFPILASNFYAVVEGRITTGTNSSCLFLLLFADLNNKEGVTCLVPTGTTTPIITWSV